MEVLRSLVPWGEILSPKGVWMDCVAHGIKIDGIQMGNGFQGPRLKFGLFKIQMDWFG